MRPKRYSAVQVPATKEAAEYSATSFRSSVCVKTSVMEVACRLVGLVAKVG
jgi:hypothetical protein